MKFVRLLSSLLVVMAMHAVPALAHHTLQKDVSDLLGPQFWGIFLVIPVPFIIIGTIAFLWYRNNKRVAEAQSDAHDEVNWSPKLN